MDTESIYIFQAETEKIIGACFDVHRQLGPGFLEPVYQEALSIEFNNRLIPFDKEKKLELFYKGVKLDKFYVADFLCFGKIIVELKAVDSLIPEHTAQVLNYLKATGLRLGLLVNFGTSKTQIKRVIL